MSEVEEIDHSKLWTVYTDGGYYALASAPAGAWAFIIEIPTVDGLSYFYQGYAGIYGETSNRMELMAAEKAMIFILQAFGPQNLSIFSDSLYLVRGMTDWGIGWRFNKWRYPANRKPVVNSNLWKSLFKLEADHSSVAWNFVQGHAGIHGNEIANALCEKVLMGYKNTGILMVEPMVEKVAFASDSEVG